MRVLSNGSHTETIVVCPLSTLQTCTAYTYTRDVCMVQSYRRDRDATSVHVHNHLRNTKSYLVWEPVEYVHQGDF